MSHTSCLYPLYSVLTAEVRALLSVRKRKLLFEFKEPSNVTQPVGSGALPDASGIFSTSR